MSTRIPFQIRTARPTDLEAAARCLVRSWQRAFRASVPATALDAMDPGRIVSSWRETGKPRCERLVVAVGSEGERQGQLLGMCGWDSSRDPGAADTVAEVIALHVDPDSWRCGIGRPLLSEALRAASQANYRSATLWCLRSNDRACAFYKQTGWALDGHSKMEDTRGYPADEVRFHKDLC